jgi:hypothetical protein
MAVDASTPPLVRVRRRWRTAIGLVAAPTGTAFLAAALLYAIMSAGNQAWGEISQASMMWLGLALIGLGLMLALGWPFHAIAFRRRWITAPSYIGAGAVLGFLVMAAMSYFYFQQNPTSVGAAELIGMVIGVMIAMAMFALLPCMLMAWIFWLIRRPDRDPAPAPHFIFD